MAPWGQRGVRTMHARLATVQGDPSRIDTAIRFVRDVVEPLVDDLDGSLGLGMWVDRDRGQVAVLTVWTTGEARSASYAALAAVRDEVGRIMIGGPPQAREYDVAVVEQVEPVDAGCWSRTTRLAGDGVAAAATAAAVVTFRDHSAPVLTAVAGLRSVAVLSDTTGGCALLVTSTWSSRQALAAARPAHDDACRRLAEESGLRLVDCQDSQLVLAGVRGPQQHEAVLRRVLRAISAGGDLAELDACIDPDVVEHAAVPAGLPAGLAGVKQYAAAFRTGFPDLDVRVERYLEQGDTACVVSRLTGTQTGPFQGAPPSGREIDAMSCDVVRVEGGKVVEHWGFSDDLGIAIQLGLVDAPGAARVIVLPQDHPVGV